MILDYFAAALWSISFLGKILINPANLLLLDEPTNHLDLDSCDSLLSAIKDFDGAVLMVTHDEYFLHQVANKLIIFDDNNNHKWDPGDLKKDQQPEKVQYFPKEIKIRANWEIAEEWKF